MEIICYDALHMDEVHIYQRKTPSQIVTYEKRLEDCSETGIGAPSLSFSRHEAQQVMNELWRIGFRPRDGRGSLADVSHLEAHVNDMRKVAFKLLEIKND